MRWGYVAGFEEPRIFFFADLWEASDIFTVIIYYSFHIW